MSLPEKKSIELLPPKKFEEYPIGKKITVWIINVGRIIIIGTELLAFSVFVGRIKLDRELTDLTEALENQRLILQNAKDFEAEFRNLQRQLLTIKELRKQQIPTAQVLSFFFQLLPKEVTLISLTLNTNESYLIAKTSSAETFAKVAAALKNSKKIEEVALTSANFSAKDDSYHFSLSLKFAKGAFQ